MTPLYKNLLVTDAAAEGGYRQATFEEILDTRVTSEELREAEL